MIITVQLKREYNEADVESLIPGKQIINSGWDDDGNFWIETDQDLTASELTAVRRRLETVNATEEQLYTQGEAALNTDRNYRDSISPQVQTGANNIINDATITQTEAIQYVRDLATAVRTLNSQVTALTNQNIGLIRLVQRLLDATN